MKNPIKKLFLFIALIVCANIAFSQHSPSKTREYTIENFCASNEYVFLTANVKLLYDASNILAATEITTKKSNIELFLKWCIAKMADIDDDDLNNKNTKNILCDILNNKILKSVKVLDVVFENTNIVTLSDIGYGSFAFGDYSNDNSLYRISDDSKGKGEVLDWYSNIGEIRTVTTDNPPATVTIQVALGYKKDDSTTSKEIKNCDSKISAFLLQYFSKKPMADLEPRNENNIKIELRNAINDDILTNGKIRDIAFTKLDLLRP